MQRSSCLVLFAVGLWLGIAGPAEAGEVVLTNGDVLTGKVSRRGDTIVLEHPVLGTLDLSMAHYRSAVVDKQPEVAAPVPVVPPPVCNLPESVPSPAPPPSKRPWDLSVGFGFSMDKGNTDKLELSTDIEGSYEWRRLNRITGRIHAFYGENSGTQDEGNALGHLRYERTISARSYLWASWLTQRDDFADILLRTGFSAGYGHRFIDRKRTRFSGEIGAGAFTEDRKGQPQTDTTSLYAGLSYEHEFETGDTFLATAYTVPYLSAPELSPSRLELKYAHPIQEHLSLTAGFIWEHVPEPPDGIKSDDTKLIFGIAWKP